MVPPTFSGSVVSSYACASHCPGRLGASQSSIPFAHTLSPQILDALSSLSCKLHLPWGLCRALETPGSELGTHHFYLLSSLLRDHPPALPAARVCHLLSDPLLEVKEYTRSVLFPVSRSGSSQARVRGGAARMVAQGGETGSEADPRERACQRVRNLGAWTGSGHRKSEGADLLGGAWE